MNEPAAPRLRQIPRLLGYAGLLPQIGAVLALWIGHGLSDVDRGYSLIGLARLVGVGYGLSILNFLGGIWWGFAMRRARGQGALAAVAVVPTLLGMTILAAIMFSAHADGVIVALGIAIALTLVVDRRLARTGEAPAGWMALRTPLSLGLGALTVAFGVIDMALT